MKQIRTCSFSNVDARTGSKETADETAALSTAGEQQQQPERWSADAGWVNPADLERGPGGNALCRFCGKEIPSNRRTFCSNACVHEHKVKTVLCALASVISAPRLGVGRGG